MIKLEDLPNELLFHIFSYCVEASSAIQRTCKRFRTIIRTHVFPSYLQEIKASVGEARYQEILLTAREIANSEDEIAILKTILIEMTFFPIHAQGTALPEWLKEMQQIHGKRVFLPPQTFRNLDTKIELYALTFFYGACIPCLWNEYRTLRKSDEEKKTSLEEEIKHTRRAIKIIFIENSSFPRIPQQINLFTSLRKLILKIPPLQSIPPQIFQLSSICELRITGSMSRISERISSLRNLVVLEARSPSLRRIPSSIGRLPKLEFINLNANPIEAIQPEVFNAKRLRKITIKYQTTLSFLPPNCFNRSLKIIELDSWKLKSTQSILLANFFCRYYRDQNAFISYSDSLVKASEMDNKSLLRSPFFKLHGYLQGQYREEETITSLLDQCEGKIRGSKYTLLFKACSPENYVNLNIVDQNLSKVFQRYSFNRIR